MVQPVLPRSITSSIRMARRKTWPEGVAERRGRKAWLKSVAGRRGRKAWPKGVVGRRALPESQEVYLEDETPPLCVDCTSTPGTCIRTRTSSSASTLQHVPHDRTTLSCLSFSSSTISSMTVSTSGSMAPQRCLWIRRPITMRAMEDSLLPNNGAYTQFAYCNNDVWVPETTDKVTGILSEPGILPVRQRYLQRTSDFVTEFSVVNSDVWVPKPTDRSSTPTTGSNVCALLPGVSPALRDSLSPVSSKVFASKSQCAHQCVRCVTGAACRTVLFHTTVKACFVCPSRPGSACQGLTGLDSRRISAVLP